MMGPLPITTRTFGNAGFLGRQIPLVDLGRAVSRPTAPPQLGQVSPEVMANLQEAERLLQSSKTAFPKVERMLGHEIAQGILDQAQENYQEALEVYRQAGGA